MTRERAYPRHVRRLLLLALVLAASCASTEGTGPGGSVPRLPERGTVVFLGDSITRQGDYLVFMESHLRRRHPGWRGRLVNAGARGETVARARARIAGDVAPLGPALVVVLLGMNDGGQRGLDRPRLALYVHGLERLVDELRRIGAEVVLATPTAVTPVSSPNNRMLAAMAAEVHALGRRKAAGVIDLHHPFRRLLARCGASRCPRLMADALHPGPAGHLVLADLLLARLHPCRAAPESTIQIDLAGRRAAGVSIAVPETNVYVPPEARPALDLLAPPRRAAFLGEQRLVLGGLEQRASLRVGPCCKKSGPVVELGTYTPAELRRGISLDREGTPWVERAGRLFRLLRERAGAAELAPLAGRPGRYWVELNFSP